ncbi:MAG: M23 family metallopeptidase, partial [Candidatus Krumholzibacteriota bacterium]|nr:M23 family metallopeptidase [Candidatus Krumholzibacteriota bacterium]
GSRKSLVQIQSPRPFIDMTRPLKRYVSVIVLLSVINLLGGCSPVPKYRGRPPIPRKPSGQAPVRKPRTSPPSAIKFLPPVRNYSKRKINSPFGIRRHPRYRTREFHPGIDIKAKVGEDVLASASGTVSFVGRQRGFGKVIIIDHGDRFSTVYAHLSVIHAEKDAVVSAGQCIGKVGISGNSTGPHLHFEIRKAGEALDPAHYLE